MTTPRLLEAAHVRKPCSATWEGMVGDDRVRFCVSCRKNVHDLSALTADEAEQLLAGAVGRICIIIERDDDGRVITADRLRRPVRRLATLATAASVAMITLGCGKTDVPAAPDGGAIAQDGGAADAARSRRPGCYCQAGDPLCSCL